MTKRLPRPRHVPTKPRPHDATKRTPEEFVARLGRFNRINPVNELPRRKP